MSYKINKITINNHNGIFRQKAVSSQTPPFATPPPSNSRDKEMVHFGLHPALSAYKTITSTTF